MNQFFNFTYLYLEKFVIVDSNQYTVAKASVKVFTPVEFIPAFPKLCKMYCLLFTVYCSLVICSFVPATPHFQILIAPCEVPVPFLLP